MQYKVTREKGAANFEFTVTSAEWEEEVNATYKKNAKKFNIQGFRKGQAPRKVIERFYGADVFFEDAFDECARKRYVAALNENEDIFPVDSPKLDIKSFADEKNALVFTMSVTLRPEVTLGAYTGMKIPQVEYTVKDSDIEAELKSAQERAARLVAVADRPVQNGDTVKLDYAGSVDGVPFEGGTAQMQTLEIGSKRFIPGFEEQMIGMQLGEEKDLSVTFPDDYHSENLKGKKAVFKVKLHEISVRELPALDDEFARDRTKFDSLKEYKDDIKNRLETENARRAENETRAGIIDAVAANATVDIPECMIAGELDVMLEEMEARLQYMYRGMKLEDYFKYTDSSVDEYKKQHRAEAEKGVKTRLVLQEIMKKEKIEATDADIKAEHAKQGVENPSSEQASQIRNSVIINKLFDFLTKNNTMQKKSETKTAKSSDEKSEKPAKPAAAKTAKPAAEKSEKPAAKTATTKPAAAAETKTAKPAAKKTAKKPE
ncbi:MAG: trigger factor [Firmicutes bacterium]|nr:trigger factor [Bacillota bacterium]